MLVLNNTGLSKIDFEAPNLETLYIINNQYMTSFSNNYFSELISLTIDTTNISMIYNNTLDNLLYLRLASSPLKKIPPLNSMV